MQNNYLNTNYFKLFKQINLLNKSNIGIFGGSFNPPHAGHLYIAQKAIKLLDLQLLIWMVTPQNPNKKTTVHDLTLSKKISLSENLTKDIFKIKVTSFEDSFSSNYTYNTLSIINNVAKQNNNRLFWIMGEDNWRYFHTFYNWDKLLTLSDLVVFARSDKSFSSLHQKATVLYYNNIENNLSGIDNNIQTAGVKFYLIPKTPFSSTEIRKNNNKID